MIVAFFCENAYPLFDQSASGTIGGMETRAVLFAKAMAKNKNWKIFFTVNDHDQGQSVIIDDVELIVDNSLARKTDVNVASRFHKHKWRPVIHLNKSDLHFLWQLPVHLLMCLLPRCFIYRFWQSINPDVVCCFGNNPVTAEVIADCYRSGIKTILCIASDSDLSADYRPGNHCRNDYGTPKWMAWHAINTADHVLVQTNHQRNLLERNFGRSGKIIRNPVVVASDAKDQWPPRVAREFVLWIGRSDTFHKRPLLMLDLARACPEILFVMIVNKTNQHVFESLVQNAPDNVTIIEHVPHHAIWEYYRRARVFVNTSAYEGFPNTFLQAAVLGVPVVSLAVDPDEILSRHECGLLANGDPEKLEWSVRSLWSDTSLAERYALTFYQYALIHHSLDSQARRFEKLLQEVIESTPRNTPLPWWRFPYQRFVRRPGA